MIIGQQSLLEKMGILINNRQFPKFSIITGAKGSGKGTVAKYICERQNIPVIEFGTSIEDVRKIIDLSYDYIDPVCFLCSNADNMSIGAKNALLKMTEEPPHNAMFIITLVDLSNMLETILSRATTWKLDTYSEKELILYRQHKGYSSEFDDLILKICHTTGDIDNLFSYDIKAFYNYAQLVANKIHIPNDGNVFKIVKSLKLKDTDKGFDPILLFTIVRDIFIEKARQEKQSKYLWASEMTTECLRDLRIPAVSKLGTIDKWIFEVRVVLK